MRARAVVLPFLLVAFFIGCAPMSGNLHVSEEFARRLVPSVPEVKKTEAPAAYEILDVQLGKVDKKTGRLTANIRVTHFGIQESIGVFGKIDQDGKAFLVEIKPPAPNMHRVTASLYCADDIEEKSCSRSIVNVYFRVAGKNHRKQFVATELLQIPKIDNDPVPPAAGSESDSTVEEDVDPDQTTIGEIGEFVGAERNEVMIGRLADHADQPGKADQAQNPSADNVPMEIPIPVPPKKAPVKNHEPPVPPKAPVPGKNNPKPPNQSEPVPTEGKPPEPSSSPSLSTEEPPPLPDAGQEPDIPSTAPVDDKIRALEKKLAPLADFHSGGEAVGFYSHGTLRNGQLLPLEGDGYKSYLPPQFSYGTGLLLSVLENGSRQFFGLFPDITIAIGSLALKPGGHFVPHDSHQNGLDVDIRYIGTTSAGSVVNLSTNSIYGALQPEKVWPFIHMIASQQVIENGKKHSLLDRIFVHPVVKKALCSWANKNNMMNDSLNREIMTRLRPTAQTGLRDGKIVATPNHHDHFHVRLRCSPYYPLCKNQLNEPNILGCSPTD